MTTLERIKNNLLNNGISFYEHIVMKDGEEMVALSLGDNNVKPTIYPKLLSDLSMEEIISFAKKEVERVKDHSISVTEITRIEYVKKNVIPVLINERYVSSDDVSLPYMNDMVIIFKVNIDTPDGNASYIIKKSHMELLNVSLADFLGWSTSNVKDKYVISGLIDTVYGKTGDTLEFFDPNSNNDVAFVLTTDNKMYGASAMINRDILKKVCNIFGTEKFIIIPSSIHEIIIIPNIDDFGANINELENMINEVNSTCVKPNEVLSDCSYTFEYETNELHINY